MGNGNSYLGEFKDGKKNGKGIYNCGNGKYYVGDFNDGKFEGKTAQLITKMAQLYQGYGLKTTMKTFNF